MVFEQDQEYIKINFADDGRGLDLEKIRKEAIEYKIHGPKKMAEISPADLANLIFKVVAHSGLGAKNKSSGDSGLLALSKGVESFGGSCSIESSSDQGLVISVKIPHSEVST